MRPDLMDTVAALEGRARLKQEPVALELVGLIRELAADYTVLEAELRKKASRPAAQPDKGKRSPAQTDD